MKAKVKQGKSKSTTIVRFECDCGKNNNVYIFGKPDKDEVNVTDVTKDVSEQMQKLIKDTIEK